MTEKILKIQKATAKGKKYCAIIKSSDGKTRKVNFGDSSMQQYKDSTSLKLYSSKNHLDPKRRKAYFSRHHGGATTKSAALAQLKGQKITAKYLSTKYLW